jgi:predicted Zn-dependent protease
MVAFMRKLEERGSAQAPDALEYLSSHPMPGWRAETLDRLARSAAYEPVVLLSESEWHALRAICRKGAAGGLDEPRP